jgi:putative endonuclease
VSKGGWTYIMTNRPFGVLYVGVTADLAARVLQHREGRGSEFCTRYKLTRLVLAEPHPTIDEAIAREKALKAWQRAWKVNLIQTANRNGGICEMICKREERSQPSLG